MADGTLRLEVDIEPKDARTAFMLFGAPGSPVALAALKNVPTPEPEPGETIPPPAADKPKGGPLSKLAGMWCDSPIFWSWAMEKFPFLWSANEGARPQDTAAAVIRLHCGIESRAELDHDKRAADQFNVAFRKPFGDYLEVEGITLS